MAILFGTAVAAAAVWFRILAPFGKALAITEDLVDREWVRLTPEQASVAAARYQGFSGDLHSLLVATRQDPVVRMDPVKDAVSPADQAVLP